MNLAAAIRNIHADPFWWRKVLLGGALALTVLGAPWPAGLVAESMENVRKGYPTPLPPNIGWWSRYIIGLFAVIIDFFFFVLPIIGIGLLFFCAIAAVTLGQAGGIAPNLIGGGFVVACFVYVLAMFAIGAAPVGRLLYIGQGGVESALSMQTLRTALDPRRRKAYFQARLQSLPGYIPLLIFAAAVWGSTLLRIPGGWLITIVLLWLTLSALVYAHLITAQLYGDAERTF